MVACSMKWCKNRSCKQINDTYLTFHRFPKNENLKAKWRLLSGKSEQANITNQRVCSEHFKETDFLIKKGKRLLRAGAIPSVSVAESTTKLCDNSAGKYLLRADESVNNTNSVNTQQKTYYYLIPCSSVLPSTHVESEPKATLRVYFAEKEAEAAPPNYIPESIKPAKSHGIRVVDDTTLFNPPKEESDHPLYATNPVNASPPAQKSRYIEVVNIDKPPPTPELRQPTWSGEQKKEDRPSKHKASKKSHSSQQKAPITLSDDDAKSEAGGSPGVASDSDSDDELLKPKEEVDSDREDDEGKTFSFQPHYLYRNAINLVESPTGAAVVDSSSKCCVVPDCLSKSRRLFDLPRASEPRGAWLELLPWLPDGTGVAEVVLCSRHFSRDYLTPAGLHVDAVPTMNLPDPLSDAWPAQEGKTISNDVVTTSAKLRELGETSPGTSTSLVNASTVGAYRNDSKGFGRMGANMQPRIHLETLPALRSKDGTDPDIKIEPELQENPSLYPTSITPAPNIKVQSFFEHAAIADYMQPNTSTSSYPVGPNLNVPGVNNLSFIVQPMEAKPAVHGSWEVPLSVTNSQATTSMGPPAKKSKLVVIKKVSQTSEPENLKRVKVKKRKASSVEGDDSADISDGLEIGEVRIATPVAKKAAKIVTADDMPLARFIGAPCILCEGKCKYKMTISRQDLKEKIFKCFGIKLIANHKFEMCEGCLSQLKNAEYFRTKVHIVNEQIIKVDIMNRKVGDPPLETEEPVKPVIQLSEKETQTDEPPEIYDPKDLSNFRILFDEEVDPRNLVDSPAFLRMSSDIYRDGLSLCKKRILIMTDKQQPPKLTPLENATFPQKFQPLYDSSEYQKFQPAFESAYKKSDLPPPPPSLPLPPMVGDMYNKGDTPAVDYAFKKFQPFFEPEKKVTPPPPPPPPPKPKKPRVKPVQVEKPLIYTEGRPPTRMGRKPNLTKVYVCKICHERFLEIQLLKTHIEGHKAAGEQKSNIPAPASRPNPNLYNPGPSREFGHIDHHR